MQTPPISQLAANERASELFVALLDNIASHNENNATKVAAAAAASERVDSLAKPPGSLGHLEDLAVKLCGITGHYPPVEVYPTHLSVFAADHGVHVEGVTAWPQEITVAMVQTMLSGKATINVFASAIGATVEVFNVGVANPIEGMPDSHNIPLRLGSRNLLHEDALTSDEAAQAALIGYNAARRAVDAGAKTLVTGEMGIGNTTPTAALICALTGAAPKDVVGRGAGADDEMLQQKTEVVAQALARHAQDHPELAKANGPVEQRTAALAALGSLGGYEIAAMAGFMLGGIHSDTPVVIDGVIANAALLVAHHLVPNVAAGVIAGHRSSEPAATIALNEIGLAPLLELEMRLGEGTGAMLALPLLDAARRILLDVATLAELSH